MARRSVPRYTLRIALFLIALFVLHAAGALMPVYGAVSRTAANLTAPVYAASVQTREAVRQAFSNEKVDKEALLGAIDELRNENANLKNLETENAALKAALDFHERFKDEGVLARVLSESNDTASRALILDRGTEDGVAQGQPVIVGDGVIIGKIGEARRHTSTVLLLSDTRSRLAVTTQTLQGTLGVLEGDRGLSMAVTLIPQAERVAPGDTVITSGIEPGVRRGLIVGTMEKINKNTQEPFQSASVKPFFADRNPIFVQILRVNE